jgi:hypothetical protein
VELNILNKDLLAHSNLQFAPLFDEDWFVNNSFTSHRPGRNLSIICQSSVINGGGRKYPRLQKHFHNKKVLLELTGRARSEILKHVSEVKNLQKFKARSIYEVGNLTLCLRDDGKGADLHFELMTRGVRYVDSIRFVDIVVNSVSRSDIHVKDVTNFNNYLILPDEKGEVEC